MDTQSHLATLMDQVHNSYTQNVHRLLSYSIRPIVKMIGKRESGVREITPAASNNVCKGNCDDISAMRRNMSTLNLLCNCLPRTETPWCCRMATQAFSSGAISILALARRLG